jgi:hypothetical protein
MARPKKEPVQKKSFKISVSVTEKDKLIIERLANKAGMDVSPFMLSAALNKKISPPLQQFDRLSLAQLAGMANNLNQMAKHANIAGFLPTEFERACEQVEKMRLFLIEIDKRR